MTVFELCNQAISLIRGKRLILSSTERTLLESLDYEGLANAHAQDEAVVCAMNFARVRDRLQQAYPWVFCRNGTIINGMIDTVFPSGLLTMLGVFYKNEPIEYEMSDTGLRFGTSNQTSLISADAAGNLEIRYIRREADISKWPPIFCDVFVYSLAIEICTAVTGKPEYVQLLEQKAQELIKRAHQIGAIKAETRLTLKEELYNRAIGLSRGTRSVKETSAGAVEQGLDTAGFVNDRMTAEYQACVRASDSVRDRLLGLYAWRFARKKAVLSTSSAGAFGWKYAHELPEDCVRVLSVHSHSLPFDGEPDDFEEAGNVVYSNLGMPEIRYTARVEDMSKWPGVFADVFCYSLAEEIVLATTGNPETIQLLEAKAQNLIQNAQRLGEIRADVKIPAGEELYNRAIALVRGHRDISPAGQMSSEQGTAGDVSYREREAIAVCRRSMPELRDKLLKLYAWKFAKRSTTAGHTSANVSTKGGWGYEYGILGECIRLLAVFSGDEPIEYEEVDGKILCNVSSGITYRYTKAITEISQMDAVFKEALCYELAQEISAVLSWNADAISLFAQKEQALIQNAYRTGTIQEETIVPIKDELIARAVNLSYGMRTVSPSSDVAVSQGVDNAGMRDSRYLSALRAAKQSCEMVRRNLQEVYPWTFLRKSAKLTPTGTISGWSFGYVRPSDCLTVLNVLVDGEPVYYEETSDKILCDGDGAEARYTAEIESLNNCPPMFREVFCMKLAQEVVLATTNDINVLQVLEQKAAQTIQFGYMNGQIQNETHISPKQEIFNRAISLAHGVRTQKATSETAANQGIDYSGMKNPRNIEELKVCRQSVNRLRDKLLQLYPWTFARMNMILQTVTGTISGWSNGYKLPDDFLTVLTVLVDGEPVDYEVSRGSLLYCNGANAILRYTGRVEDTSLWSPAFVDALCYELAEEIISATTGSNEGVAVLEQKKQALIVDAYKMGAIKTETRIPAKLELYNRAIGLVKGLKTEQPDVLDNRYEDELSACRRCYVSVRDRLLQSYSWVFARKTEIPALLSENVPGWKYTYMLPDDCLRVIAVIGKDRRADWGMERECRNISDFSDMVELTEYETAGRELYANRDIVYVRYTARIDDSTKWAAMFTEALVILMAIEVALNVVGDKNIIAILEQRLSRLIEEAQMNAVIRDDTRLPKQRESQRTGAVNRMYLDYSGIPTLPCGDVYSRRPCYEGGTNQLCCW